MAVLSRWLSVYVALATTVESGLPTDVHHSGAVASSRPRTGVRPTKGSVDQRRVDEEDDDEDGENDELLASEESEHLIDDEDGDAVDEAAEFTEVQDEEELVRSSEAPLRYLDSDAEEVEDDDDSDEGPIVGDRDAEDDLATAQVEANAGDLNEADAEIDRMEASLVNEELAQLEDLRPQPLLNQGVIQVPRVSREAAQDPEAIAPQREPDELKQFAQVQEVVPQQGAELQKLAPLFADTTRKALRRLGKDVPPENASSAEPAESTSIAAGDAEVANLSNVSEAAANGSALSDFTEVLSFDYHKPLFPLNMRQDGATIALAVLGLMIAASGGIGGGGILVPLFMLVLGFRPKHAIALSNFTIFGGSIANTVMNVRKRHPRLDKPLIDWDLILIMEPFTIFGAVFGSLLSKVLPNVILTTTLVAILAFMGHRTFGKGVKMWKDESKDAKKASQHNAAMEMLTPEVLAMTEASTVSAPTSMDSLDGPELSYLELQSDSETNGADEKPVSFKVGALTACFFGTCVITILKGGGNFPSPLGFGCGSGGFWLLYFGSLPWVLAFAIYFRWLLVGEYQRKLLRGHIFSPGEVEWDSWNTIKYPAICAISGLLAGLFGVGGGIVKGPLMLEMGIPPAVSSASAAAMILFTSAAASTSFVVFGLLHHSYGAVFFLLGFTSTMVGQYSVSILVERYNRQSPIVLSIGMVICLSSVLVAVNTVAGLLGPDAADYFEAHGVCSTKT